MAEYLGSLFSVGLLEEDDGMGSKQIVIVLGLLFGPTSVPVSTAHVSSHIDLPIAVAVTTCEVRHVILS
jgi:hypothetical protein